MRSRRVVTLVVTLTAGALALTPAAVGATATQGAGFPAKAGGGDSFGDYFNILPPGQSGNINAADLAKVLAGDPQGRTAVDGENAPKNFADQLEMYDALNKRKPSDLTRSDISTYYKRGNFTPDKVARQTEPKQGVDIKWDSYGVPYIHGSTYDNTMYGAGYAATKDRMFLMDVLRHAGRAELASFAGATPANVKMDQDQLRTAFYTEKEAQAQIGKAAQRYGAEGRKLARAADAFIAGINAAQQDMCPAYLPTGPDCPAEYAALQKKPKPWTRADVTYVASLVGGIFGKGGGSEYANSQWLQRLRQKFGPHEGRRIYEDLREKNDADAPTTASVRTPYGGGDHVHPGRPGVALPDLNGKTAPGTGDPVDGTDAPLPGTGDLLGTETSHEMDTPLGKIDVPIVSNGMSNALVVAGKNTRSGHPMAVMGPQTGYYTPQLLTEEVLVGPGVKARGVSFAGTNLVVQLGRGVDYAWSATSASNDLVDTVAEPLCNTDGSEPTVHSTAYRIGTRCVPMEKFTHSYLAVPNAAAPDQPPKKYSYRVLRTRHGLVQLRTTVNGKPVAIVTQRSTYGHEVDSVIGFSRFNDPDYVTDAKQFQKAAGAIDYTFNWLYADDQDISYYSSGKLPIRADGVDFDLPRWGAKRFDWQGWLPFDRHVHQTNPPQGYFVSWNNKTAPGFSSADGVWGDGTVYRSLAIEDRIKRQTAGEKKVGLADTVGILADAATVDSRARYTLPWLLKAIGKDPRTRAARRALQRWLDDGAHRVDRDRDGHYAHEQAIALFDDWWQSGKKSVAYDVMAGRLGQRLTHQLPQPVDNHPRTGRGSAWNGIAWYGYVNKDLRQILGKSLQEPYHVDYCGNGKLGKCRQALRRSLRRSVSRTLAEQDVGRVSQLTYDKSEDFIRGVTAGVVGTRPIDWQNRPTYQAVVGFRNHRPR